MRPLTYLQILLLLSFGSRLYAQKLAETPENSGRQPVLSLTAISLDQTPIETPDLACVFDTKALFIRWPKERKDPVTNPSESHPGQVWLRAAELAPGASAEQWLEFLRAVGSGYELSEAKFEVVTTSTISDACKPISESSVRGCSYPCAMCQDPIIDWDKYQKFVRDQNQANVDYAEKLKKILGVTTDYLVAQTLIDLAQIGLYGDLEEIRYSALGKAVYIKNHEQFWASVRVRIDEATGSIEVKPGPASRDSQHETYKGVIVKAPSTYFIASREGVYARIEAYTVPLKPQEKAKSAAPDHSNELIPTFTGILPWDNQGHPEKLQLLGRLVEMKLQLSAQTSAHAKPQLLWRSATCFDLSTQPEEVPPTSVPATAGEIFNWLLQPEL